MKQKIVTKVLVALLALVMLFSLCSFGTTAATSNEPAVKATTQTAKKPKRKTYTQVLAEIDKKLTPEQKTAWQKMKGHLKESKNYDNLATTAIGNIFELIEDPANADWAEIGMETLKSVVNLIASCYGLGGASDAIFDGLMNFGEDPQTELQILQAHLDQQFADVHKHLDSMQRDIADLSTKFDDSANEVISSLEYALEAIYAKDRINEFMSSTTGNFNYTQFRNYLYGLPNGKDNPFYYTQAYYNNLLNAKDSDAPKESLDEKYNALYRSLMSTSQKGDSAINIFYDYLLSNTPGIYSIQRDYYDYLLANIDLLGNKSAEFEALQFALNLYFTAQRADQCIAECNNHYLLLFRDIYGSNISLDATYVYGSNPDYDVITYGQLLESNAAIEARQAALETQMVADVAYILNLEGSVTIANSNHNTHVMSNSDETTFGCIQAGQTVYLNKMAEDWCGFFGFDPNTFTYEWHSGNQHIATNDGFFEADGYYTAFEGVVKYRGEEVYSIPFVISDTPAFNGGDGSPEDPYVISNAAQFNLIASTKDGLNKHYILIGDIDFDGVYFTPIGTEDRPFNGHIEGNGYAIQNLKTAANEYVGLFAYIGGNGTIRNLHIQNASLTINNNGSEKVYAGSIAAVNDGTIYNCHVENSTISISTTGELLNKHLYTYAGGIAGLSTSAVSYCKVDNTDITITINRKYGSEGDGRNSTNAYAAGIVASLADEGTVTSCSVNKETTVVANATSTCSDSFSTRHPYITVRTAGIVANFSNINSINNVWSEASVGNCSYHAENTAATGNTITNNCSAKSDPYIPEITSTQKADIKAEKLESIDFPSNPSDRKITYSFHCAFDEKYNCYADQLYACNEEAIKLDNLNILLDGKAVEYAVVACYNFNTVNSDISAPTTKNVTIIFVADYAGNAVVGRLYLPITIMENSAIGLEVAALPNETTYNKGDTVSFTGGSAVLRYQDGSTRDVSDSVEISCDTSKYGKQPVTITYGGFTATYDILVDCPHNYEEEIVKPTCTKGGYTLYTCTVCSDQYTVNPTEATAHISVEQNEIAATCTTPGRSADRICSACGFIIELGVETPATGHNFKDETMGTITDAGSHFCHTCGEPETHLLRTTESETEVLCTCVICDYTAKYDANSREKISKLPRVVVSDAYSLSGENEIVVYLELFSDIGITSAEFSVYFGDALKLVSYEYGNILHKPMVSSFAEYADHLNVSLAQANTEMANPDYRASNTLLKLVFQTPADAAIGNEYPIFVVNRAENRSGKTVFVDKFTSSTGASLDFIALSGKIHIVDRLPGDVTGDGILDLLDAVTISDYSVLEGAKRTQFLADMKAIYETFDISCGDVTLDGLSNDKDVVQILRYIVGGYEARILAKEFNIKLNYNDGTGREGTVSVRYDENGEIILNDLPVVEREGYRFDGWYYGFGKDAQKVGTNYVFDYDKNDQTLYAHYTLNTISFVGNGGTGSMDRISYTYGHPSNQWTVTNGFSKTSTVYFNCNGYVNGNTNTTVSHDFLGWALSAADAAAGKVAYKIGQTIDLKNGAIGDLTLYAVWETEAVTLKAISRTGYTLNGWYTDADCYHLAGNVNSSYPISSDTTVYAKWTLIEFTVNFNGNGHTSGTTSSSEVHSVETHKQFPVNNYRKTGNTFKEWNTKADGSGLRLAPDAIVSYQTVAPYLKDNVLTLYAQWTENTYTIVFNRNEPSITGISKSYTGRVSGAMTAMGNCKYSDLITLTKCTYAVEGWIFKGWATSATGSVAYADMSTLSKLSSADGTQVNLYAVWEVDPHTVGKYVTSGTSVTSTYSGAITYVVYSTIDTTPRNNITAEYVIVDWSRASSLNVDSYGVKDHVGRTDHIDITPAVKEIYFVGDPAKEYQNLEFALCNFGASDKLTVHFVDFQFVTRQATAFSVYPSMDANAVIVFDITGNCSIRSSSPSGSIIKGITNLTFRGGGAMTITAGDGANATTAGGNGGDGGIAIIADYVEVFMPTGKLTVNGGTGGNGMKGADSTEQGSKGSDRKVWGGTAGNGGQGGTGGQGGYGGNGGDAMVGTLKVKIGTCYFAGGKGGDGGNGGKGGKGGTGGGNTAWGGETGDGGKGGTGGKGGDAGHGGYNASLTYSATSVATLTVTSGANGKVGTGGAGGDGGDAGTPNPMCGGGGTSGNPGDKGDNGSVRS